MNFLKKLWKHRRELRSIHKSIYFNFHYLPLSQAIHLPVLFYKPKFLNLKGKVVIKGRVKFGLIKMGFPMVSIYPNSGIMFENHGGTLLFKGKCEIGNNSAISIGSKGYVEIGDHFISTTSLKLVCYHEVVIGERCLFGWDCLIMDTDLHKLAKRFGGFSKGYSNIKIGSDNWFGNGCVLMKRTQTPDYCVISARTILSSKIDVPSYSVIGQKREVEILATDLWRNIDDDAIDYADDKEV